MKCPKCGGCGKLLKKEKGKSCYDVSLSFCDMCHGSGEVEMTNEEYLKQASTEELAEALFTAYDDGVVRGEWSACGNGCCMGNGGKMLVKEDFEEWLKKPHKE